MMKSFTLWVSLAALFLGGCSVKEYAKSEPKIITFKTAKLRFNDLGYIRQDGDAVQLELFSAGQAIERFEINHLVCIRDGCITKSRFNEEYFHAPYPDELLQNVLLGRKIFQGEGLAETEQGFQQLIVSEAYAITYRVTAEEIYFKDRVANILIRIKNIKR